MTFQVPSSFKRAARSELGTPERERRLTTTLGYNMIDGYMLIIIIIKIIIVLRSTTTLEL